MSSPLKLLLLLFWTFSGRNQEKWSSLSPSSGAPVNCRQSGFTETFFTKPAASGPHEDWTHSHSSELWMGSFEQRVIQLHVWWRSRLFDRSHGNFSQTDLDSGSGILVCMKHQVFSQQQTLYFEKLLCYDVIFFLLFKGFLLVKVKVWQ